MDENQRIVFVTSIRVLGLPFADDLMVSAGGVLMDRVWAVYE